MSINNYTNVISSCRHINFLMSHSVLSETGFEEILKKHVYFKWPV